VIITIAYILAYQMLVDQNINKVAIFDCVTSGLALLIVTSKYWGGRIEFNVLLFELN
tara:strand:- start:135 stop:305 length:171 start_codon:yes stop_codon:yes gene_type:complete